MRNLAFNLILIAIGLTGCEQGPAERLGEEIDNVANDTGNAVEDACENVTDRPC
jgi:hypothetical protein